MTENIAKKTLAKIEKEQQKLDNLIAKRDDYTANYQAKLSEMNKAISEQKKVIAELKGQEKQEKLDAVANLAEKSGVSVDDLLKAVLKSDFYGIQEKLEGKSTESDDTGIYNNNENTYNNNENTIEY